MRPNSDLGLRPAKQVSAPTEAARGLKKKPKKKVTAKNTTQEKSHGEEVDTHAWKRLAHWGPVGPAPCHFALQNGHLQNSPEVADRGFKALKARF